MPTDLSVFNQTIKDYSSTALVRWLHDEIPRRDRNGKHVSNDFKPDDSLYWESIGILSSLAVLLAVLTLLFFVVRGCIRCCKGCCCKGKGGKFQPKSRCVVYTFFVTCFIVIGGLVYAFISNAMVSDGVREVRNAVSDMDDLKNTQVDAARSVVGSLQTVFNAAGVLLDELKALNDTLGGIPNSVYTSVDKIQSEMNGAVSDVNSGINTYDDIPIDDVVHNIKKYDGYRYLGQFAVLIFLAFPYLLMLLALVFKSRFLAWNVLWIGVTSSVLGWLLTGLETSAVVALADACLDPSGYILSQFNDATILPYARFFVICKDQLNPLQDELTFATDSIDASQSAVNDLSDYVLQIESYANITIEEFRVVNNTMNQITTETHKILADVDVLLASVFKCNRIHNNYVDTLDGICGSTLEGFFALVIIQGAMAFLTLVAIYCSIYLFRFLKTSNLKDLLTSNATPVLSDEMDDAL